MYKIKEAYYRWPADNAKLSLEGKQFPNKFRSLITFKIWARKLDDTYELIVLQNSNEKDFFFQIKNTSDALSIDRITEEEYEEILL